MRFVVFQAGVSQAAILFLFALLARGAAGAEPGCVQPGHMPQMPQGATATDEEMKEGHDTLQRFVQVLEDYQKCMEQKVKNAPPDTKPEVRQKWQGEADGAIEAAQEIADIYSIQLRAYKARQQQ